MKKNSCLLVGRTDLDLIENIEAGQSYRNGPAPSTYIYDWRDFDGVKVFCHTPKEEGAVACSIAKCARTFKAAKEGKRIVIGGNRYHKLDRWPKEIQEMETFTYIDREGTDIPEPSGIFALWYCLEQGYNPIYTVGIDLINFTGHPSNDEALELIKNYKEGDPAFSTKRYEFEQIEVVKKLLAKYPKQKVYKAHEISRLPVKVKIPK